MFLDLRTLAFVLGLILAIQLLAITIQFRFNREERGMGPWLLGCILITLGTILWPFYKVERLLPLVLLATPMAVAGQILLSFAIQDFLGKPRTWRLYLLAYALFLLLYYHGIFITPSVSGRALAFTAAMGLVSLCTAFDLLSRRNSALRASILLTASAFLFYGAFSVVRALAAVLQPAITSVEQQTPIQVLAYLVPLATSSLWTLGFILMNNQRLSAGLLEDKELLRESEETYRSILNASPDDITITDLEGRILMVSPVAHAVFGYRPGEELGLGILECVAPEDVDRARARIQQMFQGEQHGTREYRGRRKDGSVFDIEVNSGIIPGPQGTPQRLVFMVRDISGRKRMEAERAELEARNRQLEKSESLARMAGAIAHHFNNQLQVVMGNLEMMASRHPEAAGTPWLQRAHKATERASEISHLMLAYLGQRTGAFMPLRIVTLCENLLPSLQESLESALELELPCGRPGPTLRADADQLEQALQNLVLNAAEASTGKAAPVRLCLSTGPASALPIRHRFPLRWQPAEVEYVQIEVRDSGSGIQEADVEKLFDPFWSTKFTGRGLGLSVVLGIVQSHGGAVSVESEPGRGSCFRIHLPICLDAVVEVPEVVIREAARSERRTILLVDDDPALLTAMGALVESLGFDVLMAGGGEIALEHFRQRGGEIRCLITDLTMPGMDGWETLEALRRLDPDVPVILVSGYDRSQAMAGEHAEHPQAFLSKPFTRQKLKETLADVIG